MLSGRHQTLPSSEPMHAFKRVLELFEQQGDYKPGHELYKLGAGKVLGVLCKGL